MMNRRAHEVSLFTPVGDSTRTVRARGLVAARVVVRRLLAPHALMTTRAMYHADARRLWSATIVLPGGRREHHEAERVIGESVGERGVW